MGGEREGGRMVRVGRREGGGKENQEVEFTLIVVEVTSLQNQSILYE